MIGSVTRGPRAIGGSSASPPEDSAPTTSDPTTRPTAVVLTGTCCSAVVLTGAIGRKSRPRVGRGGERSTAGWEPGVRRGRSDAFGGDEPGGEFAGLEDHFDLGLPQLREFPPGTGRQRLAEACLADRVRALGSGGALAEAEDEEGRAGVGDRGEA